MRAGGGRGARGPPEKHVVRFQFFDVLHVARFSTKANTCKPANIQGIVL